METIQIILTVVFAVLYFFASRKVKEAKREVKRQEIRSSELIFQLQEIQKDFEFKDQLAEWNKIFYIMAEASQRSMDDKSEDHLKAALVDLNYKYKLSKNG